MNIIKKIEQYDKNNIILCDPIKNNIINEGLFIKILYLDNNISFNGIYIELPLIVNSIQQTYNKINYIYSVTNPINNNIIKKIQNIEQNLLDLNINMYMKKYENKLFENINSGSIKIISHQIPHQMTLNNKYIVLKISGIWSNETSYGLTYKYFLYDKLKPNPKYYPSVI